MNEAKLTEKLKLIEALFAGATTEGEKDAAFNALQRIRSRLEEIEKKDPPVEYKFTMSDLWSRKLFLALLRRYDIKPYRYYRQRQTTVMAKIPKSFVDETLWPEFEELNKTLKEYLEEITNKVISESIHSDSSDAEVIKQLN
jgi:tetrahydromethanopterin S-methyltransferase subunit G